MCDANLTLSMPQQTPSPQWSRVVVTCSGDTISQQGMGILLELKDKIQGDTTREPVLVCYKTEAPKEVHLKQDSDLKHLRTKATQVVKL